MHVLYTSICAATFTISPFVHSGDGWMLLLTPKFFWVLGDGDIAELMSFRGLIKSAKVCRQDKGFSIVTN